MTDSSTKYWYVLSKFDATTLRKLSTFLKTPRGSDPYQELRDKLCETFEPPLEQKLDTFLALSDMGDERPAEFGLEIQRLISNASIDDVMKRVFVRCLPKSIVTAITSSLGGKYRALNAAAAAASGTTTVAVSAVSGSAPSRPRQGGRDGRQQGVRTTPQTATVTLCTFHRKFGDAARKCAPACSRWGENRPRNSRARVFQVEEALDGEDSAIGTTAPEN